MTINAWIAYVIGGAYLLLLGVLAVLLVINADLRATLATNEAAKSLLQSQNKIWAEKMSARDAALAKIKAADVAAAKSIAKAEQKAALDERKLAHQAAAIATLTFSGSDCDQASKLGKFYLGQQP